MSEESKRNEMPNMGQDEMYQFIFDKAVELSHMITGALDKLEKETNDHQAVMTIFGYAVSLLVQKQAVSVGIDRMMEVTNFAAYLVHISSMFSVKEEVAQTAIAQA